MSEHRMHETPRRTDRDAGQEGEEPTWDELDAIPGWPDRDLIHTLHRESVGMAPLHRVLLREAAYRIGRRTPSAGPAEPVAKPVGYTSQNELDHLAAGACASLIATPEPDPDGHRDCDFTVPLYATPTVPEPTMDTESTAHSGGEAGDPRDLPGGFRMGTISGMVALWDDDETPYICAYPADVWRAAIDAVSPQPTEPEEGEARCPTTGWAVHMERTKTFRYPCAGCGGFHALPTEPVPEGEDVEALAKFERLDRRGRGGVSTWR